MDECLIAVVYFWWVYHVLWASSFFHFDVRRSFYTALIETYSVLVLHQAGHWFSRICWNRSVFGVGWLIASLSFSQRHLEAVLGHQQVGILFESFDGEGHFARSYEIGQASLLTCIGYFGLIDSVSWKDSWWIFLLQQQPFSPLFFLWLFYGHTNEWYSCFWAFSGEPAETWPLALCSWPILLADIVSTSSSAPSSMFWIWMRSNCTNQLVSFLQHPCFHGRCSPHFSKAWPRAKSYSGKRRSAKE